MALCFKVADKYSSSNNFLKKSENYIYLRRQQERDLMQKARRLTDENSVSFQMFLIILSSITLCSTLGTRGSSLAKSGRPNECEVRSERRERRAERE